MSPQQELRGRTSDSEARGQLPSQRSTAGQVYRPTEIFHHPVPLGKSLPGSSELQSHGSAVTGNHNVYDVTKDISSPEETNLFPKINFFRGRKRMPVAEVS